MNTLHYDDNTSYYRKVTIIIKCDAPAEQTPHAMLKLHHIPKIRKHNINK